MSGDITDNSNSSPGRIETSENQEGGVWLMAKAFNPISPEWNLSSLSFSLSPFFSLSCSLGYETHPPVSLSLPLTFCHWRFLRSHPPLARALLTQGSEEDGQTTSQGFLKPATSAWNWLLTSRIDFHSLTPSSPHAPRPPRRVFRAYQFVPSAGSFAPSPRDHNFYPSTSR